MALHEPNPAFDHNQPRIHLFKNLVKVSLAQVCKNYPCKNNGACIAIDGEAYRCDCIEKGEYITKNCQHSAYYGIQCENNGTCVDDLDTRTVLAMAVCCWNNGAKV